MGPTNNIPQYIKRFVTDSRSQLIKFIVAGRLNNEFIKGNQNITLNADKSGIVPKKTDKNVYMERKVVNKMSSIYLSRYGILTKNLPIPGCVPYSNSSKSVQDSLYINSFVNSFIADVNFRKLYANVIKYADIYGIEWLKTGIDWSAGDEIGRVQSSGTTTIVHEGRVSIEAVPIHEVFVDCYSVENIDSINELVHRRVFPVEYIEKRWNVAVKPEPIDDDLVTANPQYSIGGREVTKEQQFAYVYEYYQVPTKDYPDGRYCLVANDTLIYDGKLPYKNGKNGKRKIPFDPIQVQTTPNSLVGMPIYSQLISIQETYNSLVNRYLEYVNHIAIGQSYYWEGSLINKEQLTNRPGQLIGLKRNSKAPQPVMRDKLSQEFLNFLSLLGEEMLEVAGLSQLTAFGASKSNVRTDGVVDKMSESDDNKLSNALDSISSGLVEAFKKLVYCEKERETIIVSQVPDAAEKDDYLKKFNLTAVDAEQMVIVNHDFLMTSDQIIDKKLQQAISLGLYNAQAGISYVSKLEFLNAMHASYLKDTLDPQERATHDLCSEEHDTILRKGEMPSAESWHIHAQHIVEHNLFRISPEMRELRTSDYEQWQLKQEAINVHIKQHEDAMNKVSPQSVTNDAKNFFTARNGQGKQ